MTDTLLHSSAVPNHAIFSRPVAIVSAYGDIDRANAHTLIERSLSDLMRCRGLILDLTRLEFFGVAGFSALHRISVGCARAGKSWALVPGDAVSVLLRICDPDGLLPAVDTVGAALASLQNSASYADHSETSCGTARPH
jgi:anti-anti-sigma factor